MHDCRQAMAVEAGRSLRVLTTVYKLVKVGRSWSTLVEIGKGGLKFYGIGIKVLSL